MKWCGAHSPRDRYGRNPALASTVMSVTLRKVLSSRWFFLDSLENGGSGTAIDEGNEHELSAGGLNGLASDYLVGRIVRTFHKHIGNERVDELGGRVFRENSNDVNACERCENDRAVHLLIDRAGWPFEPAHGRVGIQADDEDVTELARGEEVFDMPAMQDIEYAVCKHDATRAWRCVTRNEARAIDDLVSGRNQVHFTARFLKAK
jgi:hypothetical protein